VGEGSGEQADSILKTTPQHGNQQPPLETAEDHQALLLTPVIPATQSPEIRRISVRSQAWQKISETPPSQPTSWVWWHDMSSWRHGGRSRMTGQPGQK
jgi:hypothetical protein